MKKKLNLLSISFDQNISKQKFTDAKKRQLDYAKFFNAYTIVILCARTSNLKTSKTKNLKIIPTNSVFKPFAIVDAILISLKEHNKTNFDLITVQDPLFTGLVGIMLKFIIKKPLNLQLHIDFFLDKYWLNERWQNRLFTPLIKWEVYQADTIRVDNKAKISKLKKALPDLKAKIFQAPMRVDIGFFWKKATKKKKITKLICVARLVKQKNLQTLIKAMKKVVYSFPNTKLSIIGEGDQRTMLENLIKSLNLKQNIQLTGSLNRNQVKKLMHSADLFVLSSYYEGWGLVFIEAFAAGLPIVTTKVASSGEIVKNNTNSFIVPIENHARLSKAIIKIIKNPSLAYEFAKSGQDLIKKQYQPSTLIKAWVYGLRQTANKNRR